MEEHKIHDLTCGSGDAVVRVVRPSNHLGTAFGGDRVRIDAAELQQPAVARALWTEAEAEAAFKERERRILASMQENVSPAQRAADAQLQKALETRRQREERERQTAPLAK